MDRKAFKLVFKIGKFIEKSAIFQLFSTQSQIKLQNIRKIIRFLYLLKFF
jgi:hypothetical protein